ncbi:hypothetical protein NG825_19100 [Xanthomonas sacchari]|uniref:hypothetical protein n=1 Tax=Xanthomonas sp. LMG 12460 TaxID=1591132 RepID=UPI0012640121|nr:hypothetical protein [Xanthomonas sp. LMG 12460]UYK76502.1 hypothetical protein NG825_19100 [Xanthomonas sacchari]
MGGLSKKEGVKQRSVDMRSNLKTVGVLAIAMALAGCGGSVHWNVKASCTQKGGCGAEGEIGGTWGGGGGKESIPLYQRMLAAAAADVPDASLFEIDVSGSTVGYPENGTVRLILTNTQTGAVQASAMFNWYRSGNSLRLSDPGAVNAWSAAEGGTANKLTYRLTPFVVSAPAGPNTVVFSSKYEGVQTASATTQFTKCTTYPSPYLCSQQ